VGSLQTTLDALSSPIRREILWLVWDDELTAGEIVAQFDRSAATISSHLAALRDAGLVRMRVDGNFRRYRGDRDRIRAVLPVLAGDDDRWQVADAIPETGLASSRRAELVEVWVDVPVSRAAAFAAFTDAASFSSWLGVPVTLRDRRFTCTLEWGTEVRGRYEVIAEPELLALRWDFDDEAVPVPGRQLVAYVRFTGTARRTRIAVHQHAADPGQAEFLATAWSLVLGRYAESCAGPHSAAAPPRPRRPKTTGSP
jgi:DNA-binding transcriptional ArsR family regulator